MSVKIEIDNVCRGCLSVDRKVEPLKNNASLFFMLLSDQFIPKESSYFNMFLCWECVALLRKVARFQKQLQMSKDVFLNKLDNIIQLETLSHLTKSHKNDYDLTIEYEEAQQIEIKIPDTFIITPIKEEISDQSDNDFDSIDIKTDTDDVKKTEKNVNKKSYAFPRKPIRSMIKTSTIVYDDVEIDRSMTKVNLTLKEMDGLRKNKRGFHDVSYRGNVAAKRMIENRKKDLENCDSPKSCSECDEILPNRTAMAQHWDTHTITLYKCHYCPYYGHDMYDMKGHFTQKHTKVFTCTCTAQFRALRDVFQHNNNFHKRFDCDHCKKRYKSKLAIEKHMKTSHLPAKCELCHRVYRNPRVLKCHYYIYHRELKMKEEKSYCVECDMKFDNDFLYKRHLRTAVAHCHKKEPKVPCPDCGKIFSRKTYMRNHYNLVHVQQSKHYCELCDKYFISGYAIRTHKKYVHEKREKPKDKICEICGRGFFTNRVLTNHKRTHTGERPFMCTFCPAAFAQRSAMKSHEKTQHRNYINS